MALFLTFLLMLVLTGLAVGVAVFSQNSMAIGRSQVLDKEAIYIAEAGFQRARTLLGSGALVVGGGETASFGGGSYVMTTSGNVLGPYTITSDGYVPSTTTPASHRQLVTSNLTATITLGTNLSLAATASASSSKDDHEPEEANDGDTSTRWESNTKDSGSWLAMDFGTAKTLDEIIVREYKNTIDTLTIEYSDNGSTWTAVPGLVIDASPSGSGQSNQVFTARFQEGVTPPTSDAHRYFRARFTAVPSGARAAVREMESYNTTVALSTGNVTTQY